MRVHTIEKIFRLDDVFSLIKNIINTSFEIDKNSYTDDLNLLIIGTNRNDQSVIIRSSINKSKNRTSFSILALYNNQILKDHSSSENTTKFKHPLGKTLHNLIKNRKIQNIVCYEYVPDVEMKYRMLKGLMVKFLKNEIDEETFLKLKRRLGK